MAPSVEPSWQLHEAGRWTLGVDSCLRTAMVVKEGPWQEAFRLKRGSSTAPLSSLPGRCRLITGAVSVL